MTYLRNAMSDPNERGDSETDQFSGDGTQTQFILDKRYVKNVKSVTVGGDIKYIGYHYVVEYGEGNEKTTVIFRTAPPNGTDNIEVEYDYGKSWIYEGFQRNESELPRISAIFSSGYSSPMAIGDQRDGTGNWVYRDVTFVAEVRSRYAKQLKKLFNDFANKIEQYRQLTPQPYMMVSMDLNSLNPYDFDNELRLYRAQVVYTIRWQHKFND